MIFGAYFEDYNHKLPHTLGDFDDNGIPLFNPQSLNLKGDSSYHPIVIVQYALIHYNLWIKNKKDEHRFAYLKCSKWLVNNYTYHEEQNVAVYYYQFDLKNPNVKAPWFSGMAQGQILSLFVRAYYETKDDNYINVGKKIINSFKTPIEQNGCNSYLDGYLFIQEIAHNPKLYILNGALYAIIGLIEFNKISKIKDLDIEDYINGVEGLLPKFDLGWWTKYSLGMRFNLADVYYQKVHIRQLKYIGEILNNDVLLEYATKFQRQLNKNSKRIKPLLFISLNINRAFRVFGMKKLLFKYPI